MELRRMAVEELKTYDNPHGFGAEVLQGIPPASVGHRGSYFPLTRHTSSTNAQYLYKAAVAAKEMQVSGHGRLSAPAMLANCLLSMISVSDDDEDDEPAAEIEGKPSSVRDLIREDTSSVRDQMGVEAPSQNSERHDMKKEAGMKDETREKPIIKSFSQLCAEEKNDEGPEDHSLGIYHRKRLQIITCCMFPCSTRRSVTASKTMRSTLELLNESDELSSSNDSTCKVKPYNGGRGALRSLMNKVLCNGTPESGSSTSSIGEPDLILGDGGWTPGARVSTHQDESATNQTLSMYEIECMYNNGAENFAHLAEEKGYGDAIKRDCFPAMEDHDVEEVVHETVSMSNDEPVSSSFLFDDSCLSSSSSVSSMNHVMKLESLHPWLTSSADLNSCSSSPHDHKPVNRVLRNVMHNDIQYRLANKRMNLSR